MRALLLSPAHKHNVCQAEKRGKRDASSKRSSVCSTVFSSKANWESPVKLLELFPNANMCYQINKATKDANREIRAARLASVGRKKKWNISIKALPRVFSAESSENRFVCFCLKTRVFWKSSQGAGALLAAWEFSLRLVSETVTCCDFFVGLARRQVCREVGSRGDIWAKMEGFIPAANIRSAPEWRLVSDVQGELASHFVFGSSRRNSSFPRRHTLLLCTCDPFSRHASRVMFEFY